MKLTRPLILASGSPRRAEILANAGFTFTKIVKPTDESFPPSMPLEEVPVFLAEQKLSEFKEDYNDSLVLCADTVVILNGEIMNKPANAQEAKGMLKSLSGNKHSVVTGVAIKTMGYKRSFADSCEVTFDTLSDEEIDYYIKECRPFDKAGAYGIQDFIGMAKIPRLEGSYFTVMGLPIHLVYQELKQFISFSQA
ncbi:MAG: Maf family protein [Cytophagales bacterium]|nr:Maf family protein [Cytophagales bacterium]